VGLRFVSWAAVSSLPQAQKVSVEDQLATNREHVARHGGKIVAELTVPGESRNIVLFEDAARKMEAYARLKQLIDQRAFDILIYLDRSRLGRQASLSMAVTALCAEAGIAIYETENPPATLAAAETTDALLLGAFKSVTAQTEIDKLRHRHRMGMAGRVRKGLPPSHLAFGYVYAYRPNGDRYIAIDEAAAAVVRRIFELFLAGEGSVSIAATLAAAGAISAKGRPWTFAMVLNTIGRAYWYAGIASVNRESRTARALVTAPAQWPAIIDRLTYEQIQAEQAARVPNRKVAGTQYVLSGICVCVVCGGNMSVVHHARDQRVYVTCQRHVPNTTIREHVVMAAIEHELEFLNSADIDALLETGDNDAAAQLAERIAGQKSAIEKAQTALRRVDDAYADGTMDAERYRAQVDRIKGQILQAAAEVERLNALAAAEAEAGTRRQRLEHARDHATEILSGNATAANAYLRKLLRVWIEAGKVTSIEWN
jgi:DNA invertase Pin-like site-specific DNA recombinase